VASAELPPGDNPQSYKVFSPYSLCLTIVSVSVSVIVFLCARRTAKLIVGIRHQDLVTVVIVQILSD
jgi:hypothetical protein